MTNYNERLDEVLERYRLHANMAYSEVEDGFHTADEFNDIALPKVLAEAKQAITSLIKELVAGAKPLYYASPDKSEYQDGFNTCIRLYEQNLLKALEDK